MITTKSEQKASERLRKILAPLSVGAKIRDSADFRDVLISLEFFIPIVLQELHPEWKYESLDGIYPLTAHKTGDDEAEIFGLCIIISDQTLTPIHIRIQIAPSNDEVTWMECRLGEKTAEGWKRLPWSVSKVNKLLAALAGREREIDWVYQVGFGERRKASS